jgi:hypothetical protein
MKLFEKKSFLLKKVYFVFNETFLKKKFFIKDNLFYFNETF